MNRKVRILILSVLGFALLYLGADISRKLYYKIQGDEIIQEIPDLELKTLEGENFNLQNLPKNKNSLVIYYNSECSHCVYELETLRDNSTLFEDYNIVFVSIEDSRLTQKFLEKMEVDQSHSFTFLSDPNWEFPVLFDIEATPTLFFYDKNQNLVRQNKGSLPYDVILEQLANN